MANVRHIAEQRAELAEQIREQGRRLVAMRNDLKERRLELDSVERSLEAEKRDLERDRDQAKRNFEKLSEQEKRALSEQKRQQQQLDKATKELRKLTEGNKVGKGFSSSTKALNLPVVGGKTEKIQTNMVKILGSKGDAVRSIYEGKVVRILTDNTNHSTVMIAHGHYVSVYSHLSQINVKEGDVVKQNEQIGSIGIGVDHKGTMSAYMQFMIINTESSKPMNVMDCFKK
jgi:murein DD-endopeptidase MepM/ murein hydrolase activator NlpD